MSAAPPRIDRPHAKLASLERRLNWLEHKLADHSYSSSSSAEFDRAEVAALKDAIRAMNYCVGAAA